MGKIMYRSIILIRIISLST